MVQLEAVRPQAVRLKAVQREAASNGKYSRQRTARAETNAAQQSNSNLLYKAWAALTQTIRKTLFGRKVVDTDRTTVEESQAPLKAATDGDFFDYEIEPDQSEVSSQLEESSKLEEIGQLEAASRAVEETSELSSRWSGEDQEDEFDNLNIVDLFSSDRDYLPSAAFSAEEIAAESPKPFLAPAESNNATIRTAIKDLDQLQSSDGRAAHSPQPSGAIQRTANVAN